MTAHRALLGQGSAYALAGAAPMLSGLLLTPLVTRSLGPLEYGLVALGVSVYQVAAVLLALGLPAAVTRHSILERSGPTGAAGVVVAGSAAAVVLGSAAMLTSRWWGAWVAPAGATSVLGTAVASATALAVVTLCLAHLRGVSRVRSFVGVALALAWVPPAVGLLLLHGTAGGGLTYLGGLAGAQAVVAAAALVHVVRLHRPAPSSTVWRRSLAVGLPTVPHQLATVAATTLLVVVAARLVGTPAAGRLQLAVLIGAVPSILVGAFNNAWAPLVYRTPAPERPAVIARTSTLVAAVAGVLAVGVALAAPLALAVVGPPEMRGTDAVRAVAVVAAAAPLMVLYLANIHLVFASGRTGWLMLSTPASLALAYGATWTVHSLVPGAGLASIALALPSFQAAQIGMATWMGRRTSGQRLRLGPAFAVSGVAVVACLAVAIAAPGAGWRVAVAAALVLTVGGAAAVGSDRVRRLVEPAPSEVVR